jgi:hypothetical protein
MKKGEGESTIEQANRDFAIFYGRQEKPVKTPAK